MGFGAGYCIGYFLLNKIIYPIMDRVRDEQAAKARKREAQRMAEAARVDPLTDKKEEDQTRLDNGE